MSTSNTRKAFIIAFSIIAVCVLGLISIFAVKTSLSGALVLAIIAALVGLGIWILAS